MSWDFQHRSGCDGMEFIRVNDHMIKCLISEEDMDQYDVSIEDFYIAKFFSLFLGFIYLSFS